MAETASAKRVDAGKPFQSRGIGELEHTDTLGQITLRYSDYLKPYAKAMGDIYLRCRPVIEKRMGVPLSDGMASEIGLLATIGRAEVPVAAGADNAGGYYPTYLGLPDEARYWPEPVQPLPAPLAEALRLLKDSIDQGATTIWERLNGYTVENGFGGNNSMNSFNHYSFGAVGQWMLAYSLGIQRDEPGFQKFILQPEPDPTGVMTSAEGYYDSMYGRIASAWKVDGNVLTYRATVPANTTATVFVPTAALDSVREGGQPIGQAQGVRLVERRDRAVVLEVQSGNYRFAAPLATK